MNTNTRLVSVADLEIGMLLGGTDKIVGFCDDTVIYGNRQRGFMVLWNGSVIPQRLPLAGMVVVS